MVLVERNTENVRNGRRSRGPSPNGQGGTPDSSSDDDSTKKTGKSSKTKSEYEEKIRVGRDYQVQCPEFIPQPERKPESLPDRALLVWSPTKDIPECQLEDYISVAKERYGYNGEQALGMLFWHKHDLERAVLDLSNFTPFPDEWSGEDKVLFEQAFQFHGKSFHRIRQMLPDKSIASLVKYYYSWKKTRSRTSVMDRQEKLKTKEGSGAGGAGSENGSENGSNEESDSDEKKWSMHRGIQRASGSMMSNNIVGHAADDHSNPSQHPAGSSAGAVILSTYATASSNHKQQQQHQQQPQLPIATAAGGGAAIAGGGTNHSAAPNSSAVKLADGMRPILNVTTSTCYGCGVSCSIINHSPHGALCSSCFHHWRRTGTLRPTSGPLQSRRCRSNGMERFKRKPPRGMYINHDDIVALATQDDDQQQQLSSSSSSSSSAASAAGGGDSPHASVNAYRLDDPLNVLDREIGAMLSKIQSNKQSLGLLRQSTLNMVSVAGFASVAPGESLLLSSSSGGGGIDSLASLRPGEGSTRISSRWNNEEHLLAVEGIRRYGKDFTAIAELIGTKTETHLRMFFVNYRRRYNLDALLKEFDQRQQRKLERQRQPNGANNEASSSGGPDTDNGQLEADEDVVMESAARPS